MQDSARLFRTEDVDIASRGDTLVVTVKFFNNFCPNRFLCTPIDATYYLWPDATKASGWDMGWNRDAFPSFAAYNMGADGVFRTIREDPEHTKNDTFNWLALAAWWRNSVRMPPECPLQ